VQASFPSYRKILDLLESQDLWFALSDIVARMRSLNGNIISRATAERNVMVP